jgi:hypothetical protein
VLRKRRTLYGRLFFVMGLLWVFEIAVSAGGFGQQVA